MHCVNIALWFAIKLCLLHPNLHQLPNVLYLYLLTMSLVSNVRAIHGGSNISFLLSRKM